MYNKSVVALTTAYERSHQMELEDFHQQNDPESDILEKMHRSRSDGLVFGRMISTNLLITQPPTTSFSIPTTILVDKPTNQKKKSGLSVLSKIRKQKKKKAPADYRKNICGYITKKIIREFTNVTYSQKVKELCSIYKCDYNDAKAFYIGKVEYITGPSHVPSLLIPENNSEINFKRAFRDFFEWFLKERYLRYLLLEGKMSDKKAYIEYKNTEMLYLVHLRNYPTFELMAKKEEEYSYNEPEQNVIQPFRMPIVHIPQVKSEPEPMIKMEPIIHFMPIIKAEYFNS